MIKNFLKWYVPVFIVASLIFIFFAAIISRTVTTMGNIRFQNNRSCIVIDAGHGGVDGGATSCTGVPESGINLQIALRLNVLFRFLGYKSKMIRTEDISVYTEGNSISQKKISDLKERLRIINSTENPILISLHQNYFSDSRYYGPQVFFAKTANSAGLAKAIQLNLNKLDPTNNRTHKQSSGVFLMDRIQCPGVLIECGFLSNPKEEKKLQNPAYQKNICSIIASTTAVFLDQNAGN